MIKIVHLILELEERSSSRNATHLRGFFANTFSDIDIFHNHTDDGKSIYRYPLIQYRFINNRPHIIGINEGAQKLIEKYDSFESIKISSKIYRIMEKQLSIKTSEIAQIDDYVTYKFKTPWIALNQENYKKYLNITNNIERENFLEKILMGNIISLSKGLNYTIKNQIKIKTFLNPINKTLKIKNNYLITFEGFFKVNMNIPDSLGLGKSVSKGFGEIEKCNSL